MSKKLLHCVGRPFGAGRCIVLKTGDAALCHKIARMLRGLKMGEISSDADSRPPKHWLVFVIFAFHAMHFRNQSNVEFTMNILDWGMAISCGE